MGMADDAETTQAEGGGTHRFVWVVDGEPVRGGQWVAFPESGPPVPVSLADAVEARADGEDHPIEVHVRAAQQVVEAAGELEDRLFTEPLTRLQAALVAVDAGEPPLDPESPDGMEVRLAAEALEKLAADLAELVQEQLDGGSLATLPPETTSALCHTIQAGWRLRRLVDPPSPLAL
jgi:hypothetical protein